MLKQNAESMMRAANSVVAALTSGTAGTTANCGCGECDEDGVPCTPSWSRFLLPPRTPRTAAVMPPPVGSAVPAPAARSGSTAKLPGVAVAKVTDVTSKHPQTDTDT